MRKLTPINSMLLIEPVRVPENRVSGLIDGGESRFPTSGFIYAKSRSCVEPFEVGDFIVMEEHGVEQDNLLQDTFILHLRDEAGDHFVRADIDIEPVIREQHEAYRKTREDRWIRCYDLDAENQQVRFLASEIVDYGIGSYTESGYILSYRHHTELHPLDTGLSHPNLMLVPEREVLFYISRSDLTPDRRRENARV